MKRKLVSLVLALFCCLMLAPAVALAEDPGLFNNICDANTTSSTVCQDRNKTQTHDSNAFYGKNGALTKIAKLVALGVGVASVLMIIVGGLKFILSSGDPSNIKSAKDTVLFALVGLIIAGIAGSIIQFVLNKL